MTSEFWNLAWADRFVAKLEQELPEGVVPETGYNPFNFPDEGAYLSFFFTAETFKQVYTALLNGADLTYGERATEVVWAFQKNVEFPVGGGMSCEEIQDCLENNETTREIVREIQQGGAPVGGGTIAVSGVDNDALFGAIRFLVDTIHDAIVDVFEAGDSTEVRGRAESLLQSIPIANILNDLGQYAAKLFDDVGSAFNDQWTTAPVTGSRDRISCGLFCLALENDDTLTWELISGYFWQLVSFESTTPNLFADFVGYMVGGTWSGQDIVNISFANFASAMDQGGRYGALVFPSMNTLVRLGANNPDPDWEILCEDCATPSGIDCLDFTVDNQGFELNGSFSFGQPGFYDDGFGWVNQHAIAGGNSYSMVQIQREINPASTIKEVAVSFVLANGSQGAGATPFVVGYSPDSDIYTLSSLPDGDQTQGPVGLTVTGKELLVIRVQSGFAPGSSSDPGGSVRITSVCVKWEGISPFS